MFSVYVKIGLSTNKQTNKHCTKSIDRVFYLSSCLKVNSCLRNSKWKFSRVRYIWERLWFDDQIFLCTVIKSLTTPQKFLESCFQTRSPEDSTTMMNDYTLHVITLLPQTVRDTVSLSSGLRFLFLWRRCRVLFCSEGTNVWGLGVRGGVAVRRVLSCS